MAGNNPSLFYYRSPGILQGSLNNLKTEILREHAFIEVNPKSTNFHLIVEPKWVPRTAVN